MQTTGKTALAGAVGTIAAPAILRGAEPTAEPVKLAQIGLGTRGGNLIHVAGASKACKVVAVCDVYRPHLQKGVEVSNNTKVKAFTYYKEKRPLRAAVAGEVMTEAAVYRFSCISLRQSWS